MTSLHSNVKENQMKKNKSDMDRFVDLYKSFGVELYPCREDETIRIVIGEGMSNRFAGYNGFYTKVVFSLEGKFISQGFWE